jgi:hypothetical protein
MIFQDLWNTSISTNELDPGSPQAIKHVQKVLKALSLDEIREFVQAMEAFENASGVTPDNLYQLGGASKFRTHKE